MSAFTQMVDLSLSIEDVRGSSSPLPVSKSKKLNSGDWFYVAEIRGDQGVKRKLNAQM